MKEEMTSKDASIRERVAIRCARASMLLYSLASSRDLKATTIDTAGEVSRSFFFLLFLLRIGIDLLQWIRSCENLMGTSFGVVWKQEEGDTRREIEDLRRKLAMEKKRMNRIKLCSLMELLLLVALVLLLSTFFLVFFLRSP
ncbi:unnamed protein product [Thlaspi arvense]|uniref:Transmembrane protein n=1 Tax=Thlaspi arvense TaxID=13288 RepID=A0AAU9SP63_THLAR|nr:unnamed protein product [Thlaspi arvense]